MKNNQSTAILVRDKRNNTDHNFTGFQDAQDFVVAQTNSSLRLKEISCSSQEKTYFLYDPKATPDIDITVIAESMFSVSGIEQSNEHTNSVFFLMFGDNYKQHSSLIEAPKCLNKDELTAELCLIFNDHFAFKYFVE